MLTHGHKDKYLEGSVIPLSKVSAVGFPQGPMASPVTRSHQTHVLIQSSIFLRCRRPSIQPESTWFFPITITSSWPIGSHAELVSISRLLMAFLSQCPAKHFMTPWNLDSRRKASGSVPDLFFYAQWSKYIPSSAIGCYPWVLLGNQEQWQYLVLFMDLLDPLDK